MILGQVADDRTRKGMVKISAVVDSGAEDKAFVKNSKTGQITNLRRERNVWMPDLWVKRPADAMDVSSFQRLGR